jgi:DNA recombination-dependent growth factor C
VERNIQSVRWQDRSIPVMITEVIIRLSYFIKSIMEGKSLKDAIPSASSIKLRRQLLIAHSVATLINAGKVYVTQNPLAINWPQALAFLRYVLPELHFLLHGKEAAKSKMVEDEIINDYHSITRQLNDFLKSQDDFVLVV